MWSVNSAVNTKGSTWQLAEIDLGSVLGATKGFTLTFGVRPPRSMFIVHLRGYIVTFIKSMSVDQQVTVCFISLLYVIYITFICYLYYFHILIILLL